MDRLDGILQDLRQAAGADVPPEAPNGGATRPSRPRASGARTTPSRKATGSARGVSGGRRRWLLIGGGAVVGLLALSAVGGALSGTTKPTKLHATNAHPGPTANTAIDMHKTPSPLQWQPVIEQLDLRRGRMFMDQLTLDLVTVDAHESPAYNTDVMLLTRLAAAKAHLRSYPMHVISVKEQYSTLGEKEPRALLTVVDELGAYEIVDAQGQVLHAVPARARTTWNVELRNTEWGWVYYSAVKAMRQ